MSDAYLQEAISHNSERHSYQYMTTLNTNTGRSFNYPVLLIYLYKYATEMATYISVKHQ